MIAKNGQSSNSVTPEFRYCIHVTGYPCAGKDFLAALLEGFFSNRGMRVITISTGKLFADRRKKYPEFERSHGKKIDAGHLVEDPITERVFREALGATRSADILITNGLIRTGGIVSVIAKLGLMGPNSMSIVLEANEKVCWKRKQGRLMNGNGKNGGGVRADDKLGRSEFGRRYDLFRDHLPGIRSAIASYTTKSNGHETMIVDANPGVGTAFRHFKKKLPKFMPRLETSKDREGCPDQLSNVQAFVTRDTCFEGNQPYPVALSDR